MSLLKTMAKSGLSQNHTNYISFERLNLYVEVEPVELLIKNSIMISTFDPQSKRKTSRSTVVQAIVKGEHDEKINNKRLTLTIISLKLTNCLVF